MFSSDLSIKFIGSKFHCAFRQFTFARHLNFENNGKTFHVYVGDGPGDSDQ